MRDNAELLRQYRDRFQHVLVDEFQDTNAIQYRWLKLLAGPAGVPFVVGDDDQSIYRWRGARVENLQRFQQDFPGTQLVRLEQNYRSTANILNAANAVIAHNATRLGKTLWTDGASGAPIKLYAAFNERDEAEFVINRIQDFIAQGNRRSDARDPVPLERAVARVRGRRCSRPGFRIASTAACDSSSAPRSRTHSRTCGCSRTATTTRRSSAS